MKASPRSPAPRRLPFSAPLALAAALLAAALAPAAANPYREIRWETIQRHRANFHAHTTQSDGRLSPHDVVDRYHRLGYTILALTDHNRVTHPWTRISRMTPSDRGRELLERGSAAPYEDRDPAALGMLAVQGAEPSNHHHMGSYFCDVPGRGTLEETLDEVRRRRGLAVIFHPGRYTWTDEQYLELFRNRRYRDVLVGLEVYNQGDRYPGDRELWDRLLTGLMPGRPVWGYSNDDMHVESHLGRNWTVFLLPERTEQALRDAMLHGRFFFSVVRRAGDPAPEIEALETSPDGMTLSLRATGHRQTVWISEGREVHEGDRIDLRRVPGLGSYVRARLTGEDGRGFTYTQPIAVPGRR